MMAKLLRAGFFRIRYDKIFWACVGAIVLLEAACTAKFAVNSDVDLLKAYFTVVPLLPLAYATFTSMFLGTDYACNTMRNKVLAGHSRRGIYRSNFVLCFAGNLLILLGWFAAGFWKLFAWNPIVAQATRVWGMLLVLIAVTAAVTALLVWLCTAIANKANGAVAAILLMVAVLLASWYFTTKLSEPEIMNSAYLRENVGPWRPIGQDMGQNPDYPGAFLRGVYRVVLTLLPGGVTMELAVNLYLAYPVLTALCALCVAALFFAAGQKAFESKELK